MIYSAKDLDENITAFGRFIKMGSGGEGENPEAPSYLTYRGAMMDALLATFPDETNLEGKEKARRYKLAVEIESAKDRLTLEIETISLIKTLVGKLYSSLVVGPVWDFLEKTKDLPQETVNSNAVEKTTQKNPKPSPEGLDAAKLRN